MTAARDSVVMRLSRPQFDALCSRHPNIWPRLAATLAHAERLLPMSVANLYDGSQIRHDYSAALFNAGIELRSGGDAKQAMRLLKQVDAMLDQYEKNGGRHYGLYSLRAASLAIQGHGPEAQAALQKAWKRGWRTTWRARSDPYLGQVPMPE